MLHFLANFGLSFVLVTLTGDGTGKNVESQTKEALIFTTKMVWFPSWVDKSLLLGLANRNDGARPHRHRTNWVRKNAGIPAPGNRPHHGCKEAQSRQVSQLFPGHRNTVKTPYKRTPSKRKPPIREENGATKFFM